MYAMCLDVAIKKALDHIVTKGDISRFHLVLFDACAEAFIKYLILYRPLIIPKTVYRFAVTGDSRKRLPIDNADQYFL